MYNIAKVFLITCNTRSGYGISVNASLNLKDRNISNANLYPTDTIITVYRPISL